VADSTDQPKCGSCGRFIAYDECEASRCEFTPLNEFGAEEMDWTCPRCIAAEREAANG
jgi:hypothetical protein